MDLEWDEAKRNQNWEKHRIAFADATEFFSILIVLKFSWDHLAGGRVVTEFRFWPPLEIGGSVRQLF